MFRKEEKLFRQEHGGWIGPTVWRTVNNLVWLWARCLRGGSESQWGEAGRRQPQRVFCSAEEFVLYAEEPLKGTEQGKPVRRDQESEKIAKKLHRSQ